MDESKLKPEEIVLDAEGQQRFLDLARKAVTTPVSEEQKRQEKEYIAKHFPSSKPAKAK